MNLRSKRNECLIYIASLDSAILNCNNTKSHKPHLNKQVYTKKTHETLLTKV